MAIGFNILQQIQTGRAALDSTIARLGRSTPHVIINESKLALELKAAGYFVLFRHKFDGDKEYRDFDVDRFWSVNGPLAQAGIPVQWLNEPRIKTTEDVLLLLDAYHSTSRRRPPGAQMVVVNASVGTPHEDLITREPAVKLLLQAITQNGDILGLHEYAPKIEDSDDVKIRPWFLGRYRFWIDRARKEGVVPPRVIISEFGYDRGGGPDDGWQGSQPITAEDYAALIIEQAKEYRREGYEVDACLFGYGDGFSWKSFNVEHSTPIIEALARANTLAPAPPAPPPVTGNLTDWQPASLTPTDAQRGANMRSTPDIGAGVPYAFPGGQTYDVGYDPTQDTPDKADATLTWKRVQYGALRGWVRRDAATVELVSSEPEPEPQPDPAPDPIPLPDPNDDLKRNLLYEFKVVEVAMGNIRRIMAQAWGIEVEENATAIKTPEGM